MAPLFERGGKRPHSEGIMIDYILEISFDPEIEEIVHGRLFLTRSSGNVTTGPGRIDAYFENTADREAAMALLDGMQVQRTERPRRDWLQLYQQSLQPLFVGRSFVIAPDVALIPPGSDRHALVIPQEQAFGTGSHESTALCIELLEDLDMRGKRALDIGSGSGILALAALRLGAREAVAFDNDVDAFAPLRENRLRNAARALSIFIGTIDALGDSTFDVVTMNILPEVIIPLLPQMKAHVRGALILSGILTTSRDDVIKAARLPLANEREKGEWWAGTFSV